MAITEISFTTKYINKQGLDQLLCIRGDSFEEVLSEMAQAVRRLYSCENTTPQTLQDHASQPTTSDPQALPTCPIHGNARVGQYGVYCPSKNPDGSWCKWKPHKNGAGDANSGNGAQQSPTLDNTF